MKRLFSIELIIILLITLVSCGSVSKDAAAEIEATAIPLASYYVSQKDYDKAVSVYDRALEQSFDDYRLIYNKIHVLTAAGRFEEAVDLCIDAIGNYPHVIAFRTALAGILIQAEMSDREYELKKIPVNEKFYTGEVVYLYGKKYALAASVLETVLELNPYDSSTRLYLLKMYQNMENNSEAYSHAQTLWDQGLRTREVIEVLYNGNPEKWEAVYNTIRG